ncbi:hypothetical protein SAMN05661080_03601 [Modestobacter sp. DSM 44400]|uniref:hypothetical protein n=1 Tax=Modestobacter sp. DSM 44400 TaxID=1550230 RepID=UPI00089A77B9|nr:hypothetical protein [Modestobacter sp. DSM 44400]SDY47888.1 hypothetical protein SAMN05661080_03601 [Modestobacter sp. DSM 44400]
MTDGRAPGVGYSFALADTLSLSFQRYPCPESAVVHELPRSWGALPVAPGGSRSLVVPVADGEAVWVGLSRPPDAPAWELRVLAHLRPGGPTDAVTGAGGTDAAGDLAVLRVPPQRSLEGIARRAGGWWSLTRLAAGPGAPGCSGLEVWPQPAGGPPEPPWTVQLVDPAAFTAQTGAEVPPLAPDAPYGGWRLP